MDPHVKELSRVHVIMLKAKSGASEVLQWKAKGKNGEASWRVGLDHA